MLPEINLWCDTCQPLDSRVSLFHILASSHWWHSKTITYHATAHSVRPGIYSKNHNKKTFKGEQYKFYNALALLRLIAVERFIMHT